MFDRSSLLHELSLVIWSGWSNLDEISYGVFPTAWKEDNIFAAIVDIQVGEAVINSFCTYIMYQKSYLQFYRHKTICFQIC